MSPATRRLPALLSLCTSYAYASLNDGPPTDGSSFDYIIVGGGTAGLVLANRLSADPTTTVAVIEAGEAQLNNPNVTTVGSYGLGLGTDIDWQYPSAPQTFADGNVLDYDQGKGLGGTSLINGETYVRAATSQIDAWESSFGNAGWTWDALFPYYLKSETFQPPDANQSLSGCNYTASVNGEDGPVQVGWFEGVALPSTYHDVRSTWEALGIQWIPDPNTGNSSGGSVWPLTVSRSENIRWDAARAYLFSTPNNITSRPNLQVFQNSAAQRLTWADDADGLAQADGVVVMDTSGNMVTAKANKEVILSAGSFKSPVLLEASGVGNPTVLSQNQIPLKVELPSLGFNLQDQPATGISNAAGPGQNFTGYPTFVIYPTALDLFGDNLTNVENYVRSQIPTYAQTITDAAATNATTPDIQEKLLNDQADLIFKDLIPVAEILPAPFTTSFLNQFWTLLPFSRGSVHINGTTPNNDPIINPNFFLADWDSISLAASARLARNFFVQGEMAGFVGAEASPGTTVVPVNASDADWATYFKKNFNPNYHPVGSCAMMARELGGVVDCSMVVYGTCNVRVVDASILPAQVDGHLTSTIYAMAERAADIILGKI